MISSAPMRPCAPRCGGPLVGNATDAPTMSIAFCVGDVERSADVTFWRRLGAAVIEESGVKTAEIGKGALGVWSTDRPPARSVRVHLGLLSEISCSSSRHDLAHTAGCVALFGPADATRSHDVLAVATSDLLPERTESARRVRARDRDHGVGGAADLETRLSERTPETDSVRMRRGRRSTVQSRATPSRAAVRVCGKKRFDK